MKNTLLNKGKSDSVLYYKRLVILIFAIICSSYSFAQGPSKANKKEAEIKRLETQLKTAKANLARIEKQVHIADSLVETGTQSSEDAENEFTELDKDKARIDKEYANQTKSLNKKMNSKDKDVAAEANKEFKEIDTKYKADTKDVATKIKNVEKKSITAKGNMDKGKATKKNLAAQYKAAQTTVANLEQKLEAAKSGDEATETKPKGKKK